jgi:hypothetical protein
MLGNAPDIADRRSGVFLGNILSIPRVNDIGFLGGAAQEGGFRWRFMFTL